MEESINRQKRQKRERLDAIGKVVVDAAIHTHMNLGPGLLEHVYAKCLTIELQKRKVEVKNEVYLPIVYNGQIIDNGYRIDLLVESEVIIELKSISELSNIHKAQLLTYLKLSSKTLGYLINFNVYRLPQGLIRVVNDF